LVNETVMRIKTEKELNLQGRRVGIDVGP